MNIINTINITVIINIIKLNIILIKFIKTYFIKRINY